MADNYLERKMEEYRSGGGTSSKKRISPVAGKRKGEISVKFPPMRVLVVAGTDSFAEALVSKFRNADCTVDFIAPAGKDGSLMAQRTGSRFVPAGTATGDFTTAVQTVFRDRGDIDLIILNTAVAPSFPKIITDMFSNQWGGRVILIDFDSTCYDDSMDKTGVTISRIRIHKRTNQRDLLPAHLARAAIFLALPDNDFHGLEIII